MTRNIKFRSFSSGSCGNCYFLGLFEDNICKSAILIDAGVSPRRLKKYLAEDGIDPGQISAMLITHDHLDHIRSLGSFCKHSDYAVWTTPTLARSLSSHFISKDYFPMHKHLLQDGWNEIVDGVIKARYFVVPHDATQTVGYDIEIDGYKFVIMTDIGAMTEEALSLASKASTVVIESNFDETMLRNGSYPKLLQDRIRDGHGHLSNDLCSDAVKAFAHEGLRNVFLCHLSEHNNTPQLAHQTTRVVLDPSIRLVTLPRQSASNLFVL